MENAECPNNNRSKYILYVYINVFIKSKRENLIVIKFYFVKMTLIKLYNPKNLYVRQAAVLSRCI